MCIPSPLAFPPSRASSRVFMHVQLYACTCAIHTRMYSYAYLCIYLWLYECMYAVHACMNSYIQVHTLDPLQDQCVIKYEWLYANMLCVQYIDAYDTNMHARCIQKHTKYTNLTPYRTKHSQVELLGKPSTSTLDADAQESEKHKAFDLIDALSLSGALPIEERHHPDPSTLIPLP